MWKMQKKIWFNTGVARRCRNPDGADHRRGLKGKMRDGVTGDCKGRDGVTSDRKGRDGVTSDRKGRDGVNPSTTHLHAAPGKMCRRGACPLATLAVAGSHAATVVGYVTRTP